MESCTDAEGTVLDSVRIARDEALAVLGIEIARNERPKGDRRDSVVTVRDELFSARMSVQIEWPPTKLGG